MKYIRRAKNTRLKGKFPDDFITEVVDEPLFNKKHEDMGGWEKVSNAKCKELCGNNEQILKEHNENKDTSIKDARRTAQMAKQEERDKLEAEFQAFKAWKASQE